MTNNLKNLESRLRRLEKAVFGEMPGSKFKAKQIPTLNFINFRAFLNSIHKKLKNGQERLLAVAVFKSAGRSADRINSKELIGLWNKGKKFLGNFDTQYFTRTTEKGWLTPLEKGVYKLEKDGVNAFYDILKHN